MVSGSSNRWGLVLAGGDGSRLRSLTKGITGYELPKQFCPILSSKPLLRETLDRISEVVAPAQTVVSVSRAHRHFYLPMFQAGQQLVVEEPCNRGTAPAILHALMRLYDIAPSALLALFPSDHYFGNESRFINYVDSAFDAVDNSDDTVVLLGAEATGPEQAYGWIEPEVPLSSATQSLLPVRRFVEKPDGESRTSCGDAAHCGTHLCWWPAHRPFCRCSFLRRLGSTVLSTMFDSRWEPCSKPRCWRACTADSRHTDSAS